MPTSQPRGPLQIGPYRILRRLGAGGMGVVYLGRDDTTGALVAVKLIRPEHGTNAEYRSRLRREVAAARQVPRSCTAPVVAADLDAEPPWVATEYIDAPTLDMVLLEQGRLAGADLDNLAIGVAVALQAIHEHGVIHRDLKPSNVIVAPVGPRVIDFGIARTADDTRLTRTGMVVGTPAYLAPEQLGTAAITPAVDVFAWAGLVMYAATGSPPFGTGDGVIPAILHQQPDLGDLQEPLRSVVATAFHKDPARRPSAAQLVSALARGIAAATTQVLATAALPPEQAASSPPEASSPPTVDLPHTVDLAHETADPPAPAPPRRSWRRPLLVGLTVTVALATFATATTWLLRTDPADRSGTADSQTAATPLALTGAVPAPGDSPAWQLEVAAAVAYPGTTRATPGGLVIDEVHGVRAVDPRDGQPVWHWRDEPYLRTATELTDLGRTVVLALRPDGTGRDAEAGEGGERDRLVALDTATGEVRWDHVDADLVAAMTTTSVAPDGGDWFAVPERVLAPATPAGTPIPYGVQVVDGADGQTRWREEGTAGCGLISIDAGLSSSLPTQRRDVVVLTENCPNVVATGADQCQVTGFDAISGTRIWSWPPGGRLDRDPSEADLCHSSVRGGYVFVGVDQQAFALDLVSGRPQWTAEREPGSYAATGVDGMTVPELVLDGTTVAGIEYPDGPGVGSPVLVLRDLADGQRLREVELPGGTPVILRSAGADTVLATHYSIEADQVRLLQVDLATDEVTAAPVVITGAADLAIGSAGLAVGPATLAVDTLVTAEPDTEPEQVRLIVHGFG